MGGTGAILRSVALDVPLSTLAAPAIALTQTIDLIGIARPRRAEWQPQNRRGDSLAMAAILPRYRWHLGLGLLLAALTPLMPLTALWLAPVTLGLLLSPLIVQWTASERWGRRVAAGRLFLTDVGVPEPQPLPILEEAAGRGA